MWRTLITKRDQLAELRAIERRAADVPVPWAGIAATGAACGFVVGSALMELPAVTFAAVVVLLAGVVVLERPGKKTVRTAMKQDVRPDPPTDWRLVVYILLLNIAMQAMMRRQPHASLGVAIAAGVATAVVWTVFFGLWWKRAKP
ncbi:hypothetical protein V6D40_06810 [Corynebacterium sp. Q4381]|uniref:hypothetical protein n=1 Tax=Corynebacterium sp. Marseille-Q4381 TaxID=3121597 RepID=UPI002FE5A075